MNEQGNTSAQQEVLENASAKKILKNGFKYLAISLPFLFLSPVIVTIGFKALRNDKGYFLLVLGCFLMMFTVVMVILAFRLILKSLFNK
jgi:ABC-type polysaccharide transport system permease subunit